MSTYRDPILVRNIIFGIEDSLVSTVGLLSGIVIGVIVAMIFGVS